MRACIIRRVSRSNVAVGRVLHKRMFEEVSRVRRHTLPEQQTCCNETIKRRLEFRFWLASHRRQQSMRELAPNDRPDLCHLLGGA